MPRKLTLARNDKLMNMLLDLPKIKDIKINKIKLNKDILTTFKNIYKPYKVLLLRNNINIISYNPYIIIKTENNRSYIESCNQNFKKIHIKNNPRIVFSDILNHYKKIKIKSNNILKDDNFNLGAFIVFGYNNELNALFNKDFIIQIGKKAFHVELIIKDFKEKSLIKSKKVIKGTKLKSNFTKLKFIKAVNKVKEYIKEGDIYQANIAQTFSIKTNKTPINIFNKLITPSKTEFMSFFDLGDYTIIKASPERFLKRNSNEVISSPIKGTIRRDKNNKIDKKLYNQLKKSSKENAELVMILDLMRNDLGKTSIPGTVKVIDYPRIEAFPNVYHLVGSVTSKVKSNLKSIDIIKSCMPPASVTGCPKSRSTEIIKEIEKKDRGFYCGCSGWIDFLGNFDLSMTIRTIIYNNRTNILNFSVGSGIVIDSDPESEYNETLHKGKNIFKALNIKNFL